MPTIVQDRPSSSPYDTAMTGTHNSHEYDKDQTRPSYSNTITINHGSSPRKIKRTVIDSYYKSSFVQKAPEYSFGTSSRPPLNQLEGGPGVHTLTNYTQIESVLYVDIGNINCIYDAMLVRTQDIYVRRQYKYSVVYYDFSWNGYYS
jgi:hypothetical protein